MLANIQLVLTSSMNRFFVEKYSYKASALAFTTLLTLVPMFTITVYVLTIFPFFDEVFTLAKHYVFLNFVPTSSVVIEQYLEQFSQQANRLPMTSMLILVVSILMLVALIKNIINEIWGSPGYKNIFLTIAHYIIILSMPVLIAIGIYISYYFFNSYWISSAANTLGLELVLSFLLPIFINTFSFSFLYLLTPSCPVKFLDGVFGGLVAALLFEIAKTGFVFYIKLFPSYELIYGALGVIPIFLIWLYISWSIIIYGAIISNNSSGKK